MAKRTTALDIAIGQRIRHHRQSLNMDQADLAAQIGVTFQQVRKYETGANQVAAATLLKLCAALELSIGDLVAGVSDEASRSLDLIQTTEMLDLVLAFRTIQSAKVRSEIVRLVGQLAADAHLSD